jgi:hypothetical protein
MVSAGSFLVYIVPGFSGQGNLLITDNMVKRRALNSLSGETTNDLRKATKYYMINKASRSELRGILAKANKRCNHMKLFVRPPVTWYRRSASKKL